MPARNANTRSAAKKRPKRGSVKNSARLAAFSRRGPDTGADWGGCDPDRVLSVIAKITGIDGAVTFGTSRDGSAYSMTLMLAGERQTMWYNGDADVNAELDLVGQKLDALT